MCAKIALDFGFRPFYNMEPLGMKQATYIAGNSSNLFLAVTFGRLLGAWTDRMMDAGKELPDKPEANIH